MAVKTPAFTVGIEEEYLLVDLETRDLVIDPPDSMMVECQKHLEGQVSPEFLRSQIEIGTRVSSTVQEARADLVRLRTVVSEVAKDYGMAPIAASTHPFAEWNKQLNTDKERYNALAQDFGAVIRRLVICGMHVHVGIEDDEVRLDGRETLRKRGEGLGRRQSAVHRREQTCQEPLPPAGSPPEDVADRVVHAEPGARQRGEFLVEEHAVRGGGAEDPARPGEPGVVPGGTGRGAPGGGGQGGLLRWGRVQYRREGSRRAGGSDDEEP